MVAPLPSSAACWAATPSWPFRPSAIDLPQKEVVRAAKPLANSALMDFLIFTYLYRFYSNWCEFPIAYLVHFLALQSHPNEIRWDPLNQLQWSRAANILESSSVESSKFKPPVTCRPSLANTHSLVGFKLPLRSPTKTSKLRELWQSRAKETTWKNLSLSVCHESKLYAICYIYIYTYTWCTHLSIYLSVYDRQGSNVAPSQDWISGLAGNLLGIHAGACHPVAQLWESTQKSMGKEMKGGNPHKSL